MEQLKKMTERNVEDVFALTPLQEGMLFHYLQDPGSELYFEQLILELQGEIDLTCFERAWNFVSETNEMLRTAFRWKKVKKPVQVVFKAHPPELRFYDFADRDGSERKKAIAEVIERDRQEKFDLSRVPFRVTLGKIEKLEYQVLISSHHILYDGWSSGIIVKEFFQAYRRQAGGNKLTSPPAKRKFKEYVKWLQTQQTRDTKKQEEFWQNYLKGFDRPIELSIKKKNPPGQKGTIHYSLRFSHVIMAGLENLLKNSTITIAALLYSAWGILLQKYNNCDDVVFGTTVSGRTAKIKGIEDMAGLFINTVPLRIRSAPQEITADLLSRIDNAVRRRQEYEHTSLVDIKEYSETDNREDLFDTVMVIENYPLETGFVQNEDRFSLQVGSYSMVEQTHYDLTLTVSMGRDLEVTFAGKREFFDREGLVRLSHHFRCIIENMIGTPGQEISAIQILSPEEKRKLCYEFNNTKSEYPKDKTLQRLFAEQVEQTPDRVALIGPKLQIARQRQSVPVHLTYRELHNISGCWANRLREKGVQSETIVGLLVERSVEMIVGILGILKAGAAYLPLDPGYPRQRIDYLLADSKAKILLNSEEIASFSPGISSAPQAFETCPKGTTSRLRLPPAPAASLAYIIYTSGSTGKSKGVMVEHTSVVNVLSAMHRHFPCQESDAYLFKTPVVFDVSVTELFGWFLGGGRLAILEKEGEKDPGKIVDMIELAGITHINFVPSMFNAFLGVLNPRHVLQLSGLKYIFLAGEVLLPGVVNKFRSLNTTIVLENLYGPTEGTIYASRYGLSQEKGITTIPIGKPLANVLLDILDRYDCLQPIDVPGELCISGAGVARGYLNNPELTAEKFMSIFNRYNRSYKSYRTYISKKKNYFPHQSLNTQHSTLYKTGDLARWLADGNIEFLGRIDQQVKIRGFRIEPGEIENRLLSYENVNQAVVIARESGEGEKYLCAYLVAGTPLNIPQLREYLLKQLPAYMVPAYVTQIERIPLTASGKIDRKALPIPLLTSGKTYAAPRNKLERALVEIWSDILEIPGEQIGIDHHFFEMGGHSLKILRLLARIYKELNVELTLPEIFNILSVRQLAQYIEKKEKTSYPVIEPVEKREYYALSSAQKRLFIFQQKNPRSLAYHLTGLMYLEGDPQGDKLAEVFKKIVARHESLKTSFETTDDEPVQWIHDEVEFKIEYDETVNRQKAIGNKEEIMPESFIRDFIRPFDLSLAPLFRVGLKKLETGKPGYLLLVDMHHIAADGISIGIITREFMDFYRAKELPELKIQYKDFSQWQQGQLQLGKISLQESYWLEQFPARREPPVLHLPTDFTRPAEKGFQGSALGFALKPGETGVLRYLAAQSGTTLFIVMLAAFNVFFSKLTGQEDIVMGIPVSGRRHSDLDAAVGMFVNTLALRNYPRGGKRFLVFLAEVGENFLEAMENQDYPFEDLVEKSAAPLDASRNPLFDVMVVKQNLETETLEIPGLRLTPVPYQRKISKFDMTFIAAEKRETLDFTVSYSTVLFKEETILRFTGFFKKIISAVLENPAGKLAEIEMISLEEKQRLLYEVNDTETVYPVEKTLHRLFAEQVERTPDHLALTANDISITYSELNKKSRQLALFLGRKGVGPDIIVGIMVERSPEMIIGILGILKAGGAYLPIDPGYPKERIDYMIADSGAKILLTGDHDINSQGSTVNRQLSIINCLKKNQEAHLHLSPPPLPVPAPVTSLAYIIYTSGSGGQPKGVMVEHRNAVNVVWWYGKKYHLAAGVQVLQMSDYTFDPSVNQVFGTLHRGALLCLISKKILTDMELLRRYIKKHHIRVVNFVPLVLKELLTSGPRLESIRVVLSGGEKLDNPVKDAILEKGYELYNQYGPTETTIDALVEKCSTAKVTLGKPIANTRCYILDKDNNPAPVGVPGELYVAGAGVARGYLNQPELTYDKFGFAPWYSHANDAKKNKRFCGGSRGAVFSKSAPLAAGGKIYKTGDQARWLPGGNIEFLGRIDHQVKIRGFRIEVEEIENRLLRLEGIQACAVTARETVDTLTTNLPGNESHRYLCAYFVSNRDWDTAQLREYLAGAVPEYMVPSHFVPMQQLPLTDSGKLDRRALPEPGSGKILTAPANHLEESLTKIWSEVLRIKAEDLGMEDNFFELGGHSINMTIIASRIHQELDIKVSLQELFNRLTIRETAQYISENVKDKHIPLMPVEKKEYYLTPSVQKRLYVLQQMNPANTQYNMPGVVLLEGELRREQLEVSFARLLKRHEILRSSFLLVDGEPVQKPRAEVDLEIDYYEADKEVEKILADFLKPFNLARAPLLRLRLIKTGKSKHIFMIDMHHIITDGVSIDIFIREFAALYENKVLLQRKIQYKDYAQWRVSPREKESMKSRETYWMKTLAGELPILKIPTDFARPPLQRVEGATLNFELQGRRLQGLREIALQEEATLYMMVMTLFNIMLAKICGQREIVLGVPVAGRQHVDIQPTIGMFVNMLVIRNDAEENQTCGEFLGKVKQQMLKALENQDYLFEDLVNRLVVKRDMSRNPLFDVMFDLQEIETAAGEIHSLKISPYPFTPGISRFDISLIGEDRGKRLSLFFEYSTKLFKRETIERFIKYFNDVVDAVVEDPGIKLKNIGISHQLFDKKLVNPQMSFEF